MKRLAANVSGITLASAIVLCTAGCQPTLMPTPAAFYGGNADPFTNVPEADRTTAYDVYVFTDREPSGKTAPAPFYSDDRSREGRPACSGSF